MKNRMMTIAVIALVVLTGSVMMSCGTDRYADVRKLLSEAIAANEAFLKAIEAATDGKTVAAAITTWGKSFETVSNQIEGLDKRYPELEKNPPGDLIDLTVKYEKSTRDAVDAMLARSIPFATDPEIIRAMQSIDLK